MSKWLDDDRAPVAPPLSTEAPPHNTHAEVQSKGAEGVPEQQAKGVPEQQAEERLMAGAVRPLAQGLGVDPRAVPGCSGRQRRFRTMYREADV